MPRSLLRSAGFQLWINLPAKDKMMKPRYQDYQAEDIPVAEKDGASGGWVLGTPLLVECCRAAQGHISDACPTSAACFAVGCNDNLPSCLCIVHCLPAAVHVVTVELCVHRLPLQVPPITCPTLASRAWMPQHPALQCA